MNDPIVKEDNVINPLKYLIKYMDESEFVSLKTVMEAWNSIGLCLFICVWKVTMNKNLESQILSLKLFIYFLFFIFMANYSFTFLDVKCFTWYVLQMMCVRIIVEDREIL